MNVLMITPRVDPKEDVLGFIYYWIESFGHNIDNLAVLTGKMGNPEDMKKLPKNIQIYQLYPHKGIIRIFYAAKFIFNLLYKKKADMIFTHMYPSFTIFSAPFAFFFRKPLVMFYAHGAVNLKLRLAHMVATKVATSSEKGFRINSPKRVVIGQGIDVKKFKAVKKRDDTSTILYVGRISPVKNIDTLVKATEKLKDIDFKVIILGKPYGSEGKVYLEELKKQIKIYGFENKILFKGKIPFKDIIKYYQNAKVFVNPSSTGSLDKTVLEAMACEVPVVTCNEAFLDIFDDEMKRKCFFGQRNVLDLSEKIEYFIKNDEKKLRMRLREIVIKEHSIITLSDRLVDIFEDVVK